MAGKIIELGADFYFVPEILRDNTPGRHGWEWKHADILRHNSEAMRRAGDAAPDLIVRRAAFAMADEYAKMAALVEVHLPPRIVKP